MSRFVLTAQLQLQAPNNVAQVVRQIQSQLNGITVNLQVQGSAQAQRQIQQVTQNINQATTAAERMGRAFAVSVRRFAAFSIATRAVGLFTSTLGDAVQTAIDFERQLIKVSQVTGKSVGQLRDLTKEITRLSTGLGVSSESLLEVSTILAQAGLSANDTKVALNALAKAALAPNFDSIGETAEGAIAILAQFQEGVGALEKQLGSINAVAGAFAVEASDLIDVVRRTGGVFKSSGGSLNELLALFTSVRATTRESAESIGTGLRTIFTRIQRPKTIEFLKQFGVELVDLEGKFVGPYEAVRRLSEGLAGLGERDITFIKIAEELGGFRQIGKVLPLLQQFSTAEAALNVATKANNSLTADAASAQAALAIRIIKVKEEFLALVRSITETSTFQIMANTALSLASALIKIADAIKPLLPLLAAMAAIKLTRGISGFLGGIGGGLTSGRTFSQGGKVHKFARGGMVPGTGNRDTVPAMLSPGEFVIRKSSVNKLGAGNLAAMNENRYAAGGFVHQNRFAYGSMIPASIYKKAKNSFSSSAWSKMSQAERDQAAASFAQQSTAKITTKQKSSSSYPMVTGASISTPFGISFIDGALDKGQVESNINTVLRRSNQTGRKNLINSILKAVNRKGLKSKDIQGLIQDGATIKAINAVPTFLQPRGKEVFEQDLMAKLPEAFNNAAKKFSGELNVSGPSRPLNQLLSKSAIGAIEGQFFEAFVRSVSDNVIKDNVKTDSIFDFESANAKTASLFGTNKFVTPNEFKNNANPENIASAIGKALAIKNKGEIRVSTTSPATKHFGGLISKFASGGGVGTDTVPALLTPGEFVVNRASAQRIGYGSLNRMNKVGRYAKGGVVQRFNVGGMADASSRYGSGFVGSGGLGSAENYIPFDMLSRQARNLANEQQRHTRVQEQQTRGTKSLMQQNSLLTTSIMATIPAMMQGFLPAVDDNSGALLKLTHTMLGLATTVVSVGLALQTFGVQLNTSNILSFLSGKGMGFGNIRNMMTGLESKGFSPAFAKSITGVAQGFVKIIGPLTSTITALYALQKVTETLVDSLFGSAKKAKEVAIQSGNIGESGRQAQIESNRGVSSTSLFSGAAIGSILGTITGGIVGAFGGPGGVAMGAKVGLEIGSLMGTILGGLFGGGIMAQLGEEAKITAMAFASNSKGLKELEKAQSDAAVASEKFKNGTISAAEYLNVFSQSAETIKAGQKYIDPKVKQSLEGRSEIGSGAILRNIAAYLGGGLFGMETASTRNKRLSQEGVEAVKGQRENEAKLFESSSEARNAAIRSTIARGGSVDDAKQQVKNKLGLDPKEMRDRANIIKAQEEAANKAGDSKLAAELNAQYSQLIAQADQLEYSFENISKEVERSKAAFEAMNLGLRPATSQAEAMSATMERFSAGLEVGGDMFSTNAEFLSKAMSSAAEAMDSNDLKNATESVKQNLLNMGVDPKYVQKFETNTNAFIQAQQNYTKAFDRIKAGIAANDFKQLSADDLKDKFAEELTVGLGDEAKNNLSAIIKNIELSPQEVDDILGGNLQVFGDKLGEAGKKQFDDIMKIAEERRKAEQVLIDLTKQRIEAERNYIEAQKEALSIQMEARELQGKYGGTAVTNDERRANILAKANVGASGMGLSNLRSGSTNELLRRNNEIRQRFGSLEGGRRVEGGMAGTQGVIDDATQADLQKASKDQITTIRELIKIQEDELKILEEKNKLEKDSLDALIAGDVDKFFEQQAAVGATAAIATGNSTLMQSFGAKALGNAYTDIQRQQEAGVPELYGIRLAGAGGLTERAMGASLAARGVTDPRAAQVAARTTNEQEAVRRNIRGLSTALADAGQTQADLAEMRLNTAIMNVEQAQIKLANVDGLASPSSPINNANANSVTSGAGAGAATSSSVVSSGSRSGGPVFAGGSMVNKSAGVVSSVGNFGGIDPETITKLMSTFDKFNVDFSSNIDRLANTNLSIKLDATNVNVNLSGGDFLAKLTKDVQQSVLQEVSNKLQNASIGNDGKLKMNSGSLAGSPSVPTSYSGK